jgi:hypothetical protein
MTVRERLKAAQRGEDVFVTPTEALNEIMYLRAIIQSIVVQCDQGGDSGKVFARDDCIQQARKALQNG